MKKHCRDDFGHRSTEAQRDRKPHAGTSVLRIGPSFGKLAMGAKVGHHLMMLCLGLILASTASALAKTKHEAHEHKAKILYIWAGDAARSASDFLAVVNFDQDSRDYGKVIRTVPLPCPGNIGNEPHHMHLSADGNVLVCGGLLSLVRGQNGIFFFDVLDAEDPKFISSTSAPLSSITDDFYPLPEGGFLTTQMGSETGGAPGRIAEFDANLQLVKEWPENPPQDGFNPHGISVRPELNLMVTSDFVNPVTTLNLYHGDVELRGSVRVWDLAARSILRTVQIPSAIGTMDVHLIPGDRQGRAFTAGMFDGFIYLVNTTQGTAQPVFDLASIAGTSQAMPQVMAMPETGDRLIVPLRQTGQIVMLDVSKPQQPTLLSVVDLGLDSGPHDIDLTDDDQRLVVTDYFLDEDDFGKIHFDGDRKVHVLKVHGNKLELDERFDLDFNTAFSRPARPHGIATK
jgi:selenium-binding protein 1